jgi:hypothetical protein
MSKEVKKSITDSALIPYLSTENTPDSVFVLFVKNLLMNIIIKQKRQKNIVNVAIPMIINVLNVGKC